ncbi:transposase [Plakobranchus ocellatus]|uniref:Transposase n=1 Tax=Plakobranchus ocellatus TaxID=259542 RepID=A0AAV4BI89_9GAST|nr:transposase [Plakobranchus ocellatus]
MLESGLPSLGVQAFNRRRSESPEGNTKPANSPDLNPIEYLRDSMDLALRHQERQPTNLQELAMELVRIWGEILQRDIRQLALSMRRRCAAVINSGGGHTRY